MEEEKESAMDPDGGGCEEGKADGASVRSHKSTLADLDSSDSSGDEEYLNYKDKPLNRDDEDEDGRYDPVPLRVRPLLGVPEPDRAASDVGFGGFRDLDGWARSPSTWAPLPRPTRPFPVREVARHGDDLAVVGRVLGLLDASGYPVKDGLTEPEVRRLEAHYRFAFPPEPRYLLRLGVPTGSGWHDWHAQLRRVKAMPPTLDVPEPLAPDDQVALAGPRGDVVFQLDDAGVRLVWRDANRFHCAAYEAGDAAAARLAALGDGSFPDGGEVREVRALRWVAGAVGPPDYAPWWADDSEFEGSVVATDREGKETVFPLAAAVGDAPYHELLRSLRDLATRAFLDCDIPPMDRALLPGPCGDVEFSLDAGTDALTWRHRGAFECARYERGLAAEVLTGAWGDDATHVVARLDWIPGAEATVPYAPWWPRDLAFQGTLVVEDATGATRFPM